MGQVLVVGLGNIEQVKNYNNKKRKVKASNWNWEECW